MKLKRRGSRRLATAAVGLCVGAALAAPAANAAYVNGRTFLPGVPASERVVRDGESRTLLVNEREITRITGSGTVDTTFGDEGTVHTRNVGVAVLATGKILVLHPGVPGSTEPSLTQLRANGTPDPTFGTAGSIVVPLGKRFNTATALTAMPGGRIIVAGQTGEALDQRSGVIKGADVIVRLRPNGELDPSFGTGGRLNFGEAGPGGYYAYYYAYYGLSIAIGNLTLTPEGGIIAQTEEGNAFLRIGRAGRVDGTFGQKGIAKVPKLGGGAELQPVLGPVMLPTGNLIVVGTYDAAPNAKASRYRVASTRLTGKGKIDRNYGENGFAEFGNEGDLFATGAILGREGGVAIETIARVPRGANLTKLGALSLKKGGALDPAFADGGRLTTEFNGAIQGDGLVAQPEGRVLLVGYRSAAKAANEGTLLARVPLVAKP